MATPNNTLHLHDRLNLYAALKLPPPKDSLGALIDGLKAMFADKTIDDVEIHDLSDDALHEVALMCMDPSDTIAIEILNRWLICLEREPQAD